MVRIYHVSDLHFQGKPEQNKDAVRLLDDVWKLFQGDLEHNHLAVTGDFVNDATEDQFDRAVESLKRFTVRHPPLVVPGNHDVALGGNIYAPFRERRFSDHFLAPLGIKHSFLNKEPKVDELTDGQGTNVLAIGLSSIRQTETSSDFAEGEVGTGQLQALDRLLAAGEYEGHWRFVYLHHRPFRWIPFPTMYLVDTKELRQIVEDRADVLAFGHQFNVKTDEERRSLHADFTYETTRRPYVLNANSSVNERYCLIVELNGIRSTLDSSGLKVDVKYF